MAFRLAPRLHQAHLSWIVLLPTARGGLVSKPLLQNLLLIERDCGITRVTLHAGLSHGGYVWAIHGFLPETDAKWLQLAARLRAKLAALAPPLPPLQAQAINQVLSSSDRFALRAVAAAVTPVGVDNSRKHLLLANAGTENLHFSDSVFSAYIPETCRTASMTRNLNRPSLSDGGRQRRSRHADARLNWFPASLRERVKNRQTAFLEVRPAEDICLPKWTKTLP